MSVPVEILTALGPNTGWAVVMVWLMWQLYCPVPNHTTKLQQFHNDLTERLERIEVTQIALAEEVSTIDEQDVRGLHGEGGMRASDLKRAPTTDPKRQGD